MMTTQKPNKNEPNYCIAPFKTLLTEKRNPGLCVNTRKDSSATRTSCTICHFVLISPLIRVCPSLRPTLRGTSANSSCDFILFLFLCLVWIMQHKLAVFKTDMHVQCVF